MVITKIINKETMSFIEILRISPTNKLEYLAKLPPLDKIIRPMATTKDEKADMTVSVDIVLLLLILFNNKANMVANTMVTILVFIIPIIAPIAIPVSAECPKASEKKCHFVIYNHCAQYSKKRGYNNHS